MPHDPIVSVRFKVEDATILSEEMASTDHCTIEELASQQSASMLAMRTGSQFAALDQILGCESGPGVDVHTSSRTGRDPHGRGSMFTHPPGQQSSGAGTPVKKSVGGGDLGQNSESKQPKRGGGSSGASHGEAAGKSKSNKRPNANGDGNGAAKKSVGRPRRDFVN